MRIKVPAPAYQRHIDTLNADLDVLRDRRGRLEAELAEVLAVMAAKRADRDRIYREAPRVEVEADASGHRTDVKTPSS